ncbi:hypothetical protein ACHAPC_005065 [Botrytis cinerea]|uniref:Cyclic nucleotide-binding domain-containing protein n=2 Tax=Botryotinia fuckeliana TaxID=40559 RepID=G2Y845_BOTF4|nr:putative fad binding domain protein [Botrytis cinerea BcDW1]CCD48773.1 hypothetical protein BofuT4_P034150.1 [Botrytis cinerea T4]
MREWLMQGIDVQFNKRLLRVEEQGDKVTAYFEDGTSATGDFLVVAEGTRSVVRRQHFLKGQDMMKPPPIGSIFGEISLRGDSFSKQLTNSHSNFIIMDPSLGGDEQTAIFCALNRISPDGKTRYYYYILLWVDKNTPNVSEKKRAESASQEQLAAFARGKTNHYPDKLCSLIDKIPTEEHNTPGFQLQSVELELEQLPPGRVLLIGDAAHSMAPRKSHNLISAFNADMISRSKFASSVSNTVLEAYGKEARFITFGREAGLMPPKTVKLQDVKILG